MTTEQTTQQVDSVLEEKKSSVAKQIQAILEENGLALYPFIQRLENASVAKVTLVEAKKAEPELAQETPTE